MGLSITNSSAASVMDTSSRSASRWPAGTERASGWESKCCQWTSGLSGRRAVNSKSTRPSVRMGDPTASSEACSPLHPDPEITHGDDLKRTIKLAGLLGIEAVITMSGLPATEATGTRPSWTVIPRDSVYKETWTTSGTR